MLEGHSSVCLTYDEKIVAVLKNVTVYPHRKEERCARQFGLNNTRHPYQKYIHEECGDWLIGGELKAFERIKWNDGLDAYRFTPFELRKKFKEMNVTS
jgi:3'-phosphoadenosine 5'-phosphosulfate synthase